MREELKRFMEEVSKNEELKTKITALSGLEKEEAVTAVIALAKEAGYILVPEDFEIKISNELSDDEMEAVAGGRFEQKCISISNEEVGPYGEQLCECYIGGAGGGTDSSDGEAFGCACFLSGMGGCPGADNEFSCDCAIGGAGYEEPGHGVFTDILKKS